MQKDNITALLITGMTFFNWAVFSLVGVILAKNMSAGDFGNYGVALATMMLAATLASFGLEKFLLLALPDYQDNGNWPAARGLLKFIPRFVYFSSIIIALILIGAHNFIAISTAKHTQSLTLVLLFLPGVTLYLYFLELASVKGNYIASTFLYRVVLPVTVLAGITGLIFYFETVSLYAAVIWYGIAWLLGLLPMFLLSLRVLPENEKVGECRYLTSQWLKRSCSFLTYSLAMMLITNSGLLVLGYVHSEKAAVGFFTAINQLTTIVVVMATATNRFYLPQIFHLLDTHDSHALTKLFKNRRNFLVLMALIYFVIVLVAGQPILGIYGDSYRSAWTAWVILSIGACISIRYSVAAAYLQYYHYEFRIIRILLWGIVITFVILAPLVLYYGIIAAAVGSSLAMALIPMRLWYLANSIRGKKLHSKQQLYLLLKW